MTAARARRENFMMLFSLKFKGTMKVLVDEEALGNATKSVLWFCRQDNALSFEMLMVVGTSAF
jgi:hypothetical protein